MLLLLIMQRSIIIAWLSIFILSSCDLQLFQSDLFGSVTIYWEKPLLRANGEPLNYSDIGGYEVRYKSKDDANYQYIRVTDSSVTQFSIQNVNLAKTTFEVAAFDTEGIYSNFVRASSP